MPTFYALISTVDPLGVSQLTAGAAAALKRDLVIDTVVVRVAQPGSTVDLLRLEGPLPPGQVDYPVGSAQGAISNETDSNYEWLSVTIGNPEDWPPGMVDAGIVLEYEAASELLYAESDFNGRRRVWYMPANSYSCFLEFNSGRAAPEKVGIAGFRLYATGGSAPPSEFWTNLRLCREQI